MLNMEDLLMLYFTNIKEKQFLLLYVYFVSKTTTTFATSVFGVWSGL